MDEDKKQKDNEEVNLGDWSPDYFPTSPKVVFKKTLLLVFFLGALCFLLFTCSENDSKIDKNKEEKTETPEKQQEDPFGDQELELEQVL